MPPTLVEAMLTLPIVVVAAYLLRESWPPRSRAYDSSRGRLADPIARPIGHWAGVFFVFLGIEVAVGDLFRVAGFDSTGSVQKYYLPLVLATTMLLLNRSRQTRVALEKEDSEK